MSPAAQKVLHVACHLVGGRDGVEEVSCSERLGVVAVTVRTETRALCRAFVRREVELMPETLLVVKIRSAFSNFPEERTMTNSKQQVRTLYPAAVAVPVRVLESMPVRVSAWQVRDLSGGDVLGDALGAESSTEDGAWDNSAARIASVPIFRE